MICYHFVSEKNLSKIKKDGFLKPNTRLFLKKNIEELYKKYGLAAEDYKEIQKLVRKLPQDKFIVAIPKNRLKDWAKSGLLREIHYFLKPNYRLEFEIPKNCKVFAREHIYQSPQEIKRKYGKSAYKDVSEPHKTDIWIKYFKSTRRIRNEKDLRNIKVPELWLGCKIPLNKIEIAKV
jgi:hypothetical protein